MFSNVLPLQCKTDVATRLPASVPLPTFVLEMDDATRLTTSNTSGTVRVLLLGRFLGRFTLKSCGDPLVFLLSNCFMEGRLSITSRSFPPPFNLVLPCLTSDEYATSCGDGPLADMNSRTRGHAAFCGNGALLLAFRNLNREA